MLKRGKKGQSHLETILSFTLFIGFVVTMLLFFRPATTSKEISLNVVEKAVISNLSVKLYFFSVKASDEECFCFTNPYPNIEGNVVIEDSGKNRLDAWKSYGKVCIEQNEADFFYIYFSSEFEESSGDCDRTIFLEEENLGLMRESDAISNTALNYMRERYTLDYNSLKAELGILYDFKATVFDMSGNEIFRIERKAPLGRPVYSRDVPTEIVYEDGKIEKVIIRVYAW